jgi:hypothetical protein
MFDMLESPRLRPIMFCRSPLSVARFLGAVAPSSLPAQPVEMPSPGRWCASGGPTLNDPTAPGGVIPAFTFPSSGTPAGVAQGHDQVLPWPNTRGSVPQVTIGLGIGPGAAPDVRATRQAGVVANLRHPRRPALSPRVTLTGITVTDDLVHTPLALRPVAGNGRVGRCQPQSGAGPAHGWPSDLVTPAPWRLQGGPRT